MTIEPTRLIELPTNSSRKSREVRKGLVSRRIRCSSSPSVDPRGTIIGTPAASRHPVSAAAGAPLIVSSARASRSRKPARARVEPASGPPSPAATLTRCCTESNDSSGTTRSAPTTVSDSCATSASSLVAAVERQNGGAVLAGVPGALQEPLRGAPLRPRRGRSRRGRPVPAASRVTARCGERPRGPPTGRASAASSTHAGPARLVVEVRREVPGLLGRGADEQQPARGPGGAAHGARERDESARPSRSRPAARAGRRPGLRP